MRATSSAETWHRSIYSSVTAIVFAQDPSAADPPRVFAVPVDGDIIAEYVPEVGDVVEAPAELRARAEEEGINPDLVLAGNRRYLLVNLWSPIGTTTNGWVTLYSSTGEGVADTLLATDPRSLDLFIYRRSGAAAGLAGWSTGGGRSRARRTEDGGREERSKSVSFRARSSREIRVTLAG